MAVRQRVSRDAVAPRASASATPAQLWPANGRMVPVVVSGTITDRGSGIDPATAAFSVVDDYGSIHPVGNLTLGAGGAYSCTVQLEARRNGQDRDGRHYTVTVRAKDLAGNAAAANTAVICPHDQSRQRPQRPHRPHHPHR